MIAPSPPKLPPEDLFQALLERPYAVAPLDYRIPGVEDVPLRVRALSGRDYGAASRAGRDPGEIGRARFAKEILCRALLTPDGPAFASADEVGALRPDEAVELDAAVGLALAPISPVYGWSDVEAWMRVLQVGAEHPSNIGALYALAGCVDTAIGSTVYVRTERPDRYFGVPIADITDGQWMAYRAARRTIEKRTK